MVESAVQTLQAEPFGLIVSNPPYFHHGQPFASSSRQQARHTSSLSHQELLEHSMRLLAPNGKIAFILPVNEAHLMIERAELNGLHVEQLQRLIPRPAMVPNRFLLLLSRDKCCYLEG